VGARISKLRKADSSILSQTMFLLVFQVLLSNTVIFWEGIMNTDIGEVAWTLPIILMALALGRMVWSVQRMKKHVV